MVSTPTDLRLFLNDFIEIPPKPSKNLATKQKSPTKLIVSDLLSGYPVRSRT
jgi:hypothetical protein